MSLSIYINSGKYNLSTQVNLVAGFINPSPNTYNHRMEIEVTYNKTNYLGISSPNSKTITFIQQVDDDGECTFDISPIYQSIVTPMIMSASPSNVQGTYTPITKDSIHNLPIKEGTATKILSWGILEQRGSQTFRGNANYLTCRFYEMFSTTPSGSPVRDPSSVIEKNIYMMWGRANESDPIEINFDEYKLNGITKKFLSSNYNIVDGESHINIGKDELHTIAFLTKSAINTTAGVKFIQVEYFDSSSSSLGTTQIWNRNLSGGSDNPDPHHEDLKNEGFFLYCGIGLKNLDEIDLSEGSYSGVLPSGVSGGIDNIKYYKVTMTDPTFPQPAITSMTYVFNVVDYCDRYNTSRLSYMNRFGAWEYITLNKGKESEIKVKKEYINKPLLSDVGGTQFQGGIYTDISYPKNVAKQGQMASSVATTETFTLSTGYLKPYEINQIQDMMMSPQIHILDGEEAKALILETSTMKLKGDKNTGLYKYDLEFKYASPKYRTTYS